jgi:hypothetical protein
LLLAVVLLVGCALKASRPLVPPGPASSSVYVLIDAGSVLGEKAAVAASPEPSEVATAPQVIQQAVRQADDRVDEAAQIATDLRWGLIQKRFERLDKMAQDQDWAEQPPTEEPDLHRYQEWVYLRDHQEALKAGESPVMDAAPVPAKQTADGKAQVKPKAKVPVSPPAPAPKARDRPAPKAAYQPEWMMKAKAE